VQTARQLFVNLKAQF